MKIKFTNAIDRFLKAALGGFLTFTLVFQVAFYTAAGAAHAAPGNSSLLVAASVSDMADRIKDTAGKAIDNVKDSLDASGNGMRDDDRDPQDLVGRTQAQVNKVKAAADENEYRNRGKARATIENVQDDVRNTASSVADDAKSGARKVANKVETKADAVKAQGEETADNVVDAVKGFFGK